MLLISWSVLSAGRPKISIPSYSNLLNYHIKYLVVSITTGWHRNKKIHVMILKNSFFKACFPKLFHFKKYYFLFCRSLRERLHRYEQRSNTSRFNHSLYSSQRTQRKCKREHSKEWTNSQTNNNPSSLSKRSELGSCWLPSFKDNSDNHAVYFTTFVLSSGLLFQLFASVVVFHHY